MSKVVLFDPRDNSPTKGLINEFFIGEQNPMLVKIPPLVVHGYKPVGDRMAAIVNFPTELFNYQEPDEFRIPYDSPDIPYDWAVKLG
jgi:dTDP-4-dehydrorhamnose 3,5-epimerase